MIRQELELKQILEESGVPATRISDGVYKLGEIWDAEVRYGKSVPEFLYKARKSDEVFLCAKRDRKKWVVVMDLEWFLKSFIVGVD
jgi:hypothetical protein